MKKDYSILIVSEVYDLRLMSDLLLTIADYKGVLWSEGFDKKIYCCRVSFSSKKKRAAVADVLASNKIHFVYPDYKFEIATKLQPNCNNLQLNCNDLQPKCKTCKHRDPENKKCDCGAPERAGCPFPVRDNYFCKFYEKRGRDRENSI